MTMPKQRPGRSRQDYGTPPEFLAAVKNRLKIRNFVIDLAADRENSVADLFYSEADDSLKPELTWNLDGWAWLNPPYANIEPWVMKAAGEGARGAHIAMLVPSSVGANWWRDYVSYDAYINHLNGRLTFVGEASPYPKDLSLLLYTPWGFLGTETWNWRA